MRFKRLDLNLLVALDVLLTEKNVSRAAEKLFLSQSATSGALARLREVHLRPRAERRQNDLMKQLAQGQKSGGDTGGLLDGIL